MPSLWTLSSLLPCPACWPQGHETQVVPESAYTRGRCSARGGRGEGGVYRPRLPSSLAQSSFPKQTRGLAASSHSGQSTAGPAVFSRSRGANSTALVRSGGAPGVGGVTVDACSHRGHLNSSCGWAGACGAWVGEAQPRQPSTTPGSALHVCWVPACLLALPARQGLVWRSTFIIT